MKCHLDTSVFLKGETKIACGRAGKVVTTRPRQVTCLLCQATPEFAKAKAVEDAERKAAFQQQTPRQFREPWRDGIITCSNDGGRLFREGDRTCYGHYANFHCASCGHVESRLTETGMSF